MQELHVKVWWWHPWAAIMAHQWPLCQETSVQDLTWLQRLLVHPVIQLPASIKWWLATVCTHSSTCQLRAVFRNSPSHQNRSAAFVRYSWRQETLIGKLNLLLHSFTALVWHKWLSDWLAFSGHFLRGTICKRTSQCWRPRRRWPSAKATSRSCIEFWKITISTHSHTPNFSHFGWRPTTLRLSVCEVVPLARSGNIVFAENSRCLAPSGTEKRRVTALKKSHAIFYVSGTHRMRIQVRGRRETWRKRRASARPRSVIGSRIEGSVTEPRIPSKY